MSELSALKQAQYHLKELEGHIKNNKWYSHLYSHLQYLQVEPDTLPSMLTIALRAAATGYAVLPSTGTIPYR